MGHFWCVFPQGHAFRCGRARCMVPQPSWESRDPILHDGSLLRLRGGRSCPQSSTLMFTGTSPPVSVFHIFSLKGIPTVTFTRWWQLIFFIFTPKFGEDSQFDSYFSDGLKPPTSWCLRKDRFLIWYRGWKKVPSFFFWIFLLNT